MEYISVGLGAGNLLLMIIMLCKINKIVKKGEQYLKIILEEEIDEKPVNEMGIEDYTTKRMHKLSESEQNRILSEVLEEVFAGKAIAK